MRVAVLGAGGFIGSHVARALIQRGHRVVALTREGSFRPALRDLDIELRAGDCRDRSSLREALEGCEALVHSAAYYPKTAFHGDKQLGQALAELENTMKAALDLGLRRVVYTSSAAAVGPPRESGRLSDETCPFNLARAPGLYHLIKSRLEDLALSYAAKGLEVVAVNPTACVGEYETKPRDYCFVVRVAAEEVPLYLDGRANFVDARDVGEGHALALERGHSGQRYLLAGRNMTVSELFQLVCRQAGSRPPRLKVPYLLAASAAWATEAYARYVSGELPHLPVSALHEIRYASYVNGTKAVRELGMPQTPLEESVERALSWFRDIGYLRPKRPAS